MYSPNFPVRLTCALMLMLTGDLAVSQNSYVNFEGKQTRPISLSPDGTRLFAVNTPAARLSVFDVTQPSNPRLLAEIPVGLEPVSVNARDNDEAWVINEVSDSVSIVSVSNRMVMDTLHVKDEPADVVFAAGKAFVSAARRNQIAVFDVKTHAAITNIPVFGENPRSLAVNSDGTKIFAAFALSGNRTTLVPPDSAPRQPTNGVPAMNSNLPAPPQVGLIVDATDPAWSSVIKYTMPDNDVVEIDTGALAITRYFSRVGTVNLGIAVHPGSGDLYVANTDARNLTRFEPVVRGFFVTNQISRVAIGSGIVTRFDLNPGFSPTNFALADRSNALAQPTAIVFETDGASYFVAAFGSDRIARVDANSGVVAARIELHPTAVGGTPAGSRTMRGPRGLALNAVAQRLYVLNRIANSISIVDSASNAVLKEIPIGSHDPTPAVVRNGRGFLYDAKLSGNGTVSCASCHIDAEMDLIAWDLGDPRGTMGTNLTFLTPAFAVGNQPVHPMKGPMTTQTLRGLKGLAPLHWRGDRTNFQHFNGAFDSLLGGTPLAAADMQAYADYIETVVFQPNPNQNLNRTYPTNFAGGNAEAGRNTFFNEFYQPGLQLACTTCHTGPPGSGSDRLIFARQALQESQDFKVPHLRNSYQKLNFNNAVGAASIGGFGFVHDGMDPSLFVFLSRSVFGSFATDTTRKNNLSAFVQCFDTGMAPAVGYTRTLGVTNVNTTSVSNDWSLLESQAIGGGNIDLVVNGTLDGIRHGLLFQPGSNNYRVDSTSVATFTRAQLVAKIQAGDRLTIMGVPPGSGVRIGIDRDLDGVLDADVPPPSLQIAQVGGSAVINWPLGAAGYALETAESLSSNGWSNVNDPVEIVGARNFVTNTPSRAARFFRLRMQ